MAKRAALLFLALSSPLILGAFFLGTAAGEVLFAVLAVAFPVALIVLGAQRRGRLGRLLWPLAALLLILEACVLAMLALRGHVLDAPWLGGLPLATAVQVYGLFLLPLLLVSFAYAWTFDGRGLRQDDLDELRRRFRRAEGAPIEGQAQDPEDG